MNGEQARRNQARAGIYQALAEALMGPFSGFQDLLATAAMIGAREGESATCRRITLILADLPAYSPKHLAEGYQGALCGSGGRPLALYESLHQEGRLAGEATADVERIYRRCGLEIAEEDLPDHASMELAFLGHLAEAAAEAWTVDDRPLTYRLDAERRSFLRNHAAIWLPTLGATLAATPHPLYAAVGHLLRGFLYEEVAMRGRAKRPQAGLPHLLDASACTLCGLCIGSCPTGALIMVESRCETALTLDPARCVSCRRCVRTCPEQVLVLVTNGCKAHSGGQRQNVRTSPRAACPVCGTPTVSQAELAAVFARLDANTEMQEILSLCVTCKGLV